MGFGVVGVIHQYDPVSLSTDFSQDLVTVNRASFGRFPYNSDAAVVLYEFELKPVRGAWGLRGDYPPPNDRVKQAAKTIRNKRVVRRTWFIAVSLLLVN